jgi:hypothetical protein
MHYSDHDEMRLEAQQRQSVPRFILPEKVLFSIKDNHSEIEKILN